MTGSLPGLLLIVRRSLRQHALSTAVTVASVGLATGLVMAVLAVSAQTRDAFTGGPVGFDAVLGARGSQLQLVMNTVFHLETSPGNISWEMYRAVKADERVELAVPYAVGDNYEGFRIVGTTEEMFTRFEYRAGSRFRVQPGGRVFDPGRMEAVLGHVAAQRTGLGVGSTFHPSHGVEADPEEDHEEEYVVVGVLEPTNSPSDRVIWIPIDGVFHMDGHVLRGTGEEFRPRDGEAIPEGAKEVSAVMIKFKNPATGLFMSQTVNTQGKVATLAWPISRIMSDLFDRLGWVNRILELVAALVVAVAGGSILASLYNTMNERRREFAILRALGARRRTVFSAIVLESSAIALLGSLAGYLFYGGILAVAAVVIRSRTGVVLDVLSFHPALVLTPAGMVLLGALSGLLPAFKAYATDVAENLNPTS